MFSCDTCPREAEVTLVRNSTTFDLDGTVKRARNIGWLVEGLKVTCPGCQEARRRRAKGESPGPKAPVLRLVPAPSPTEEPIMSKSIAGPAPVPADPFGAKLASATPPDPEVARAVGVPRTLTPDERLAVRALVEKHFDEGQGRYLSGYSDARVGEECRVPRLAVERLREAAYGPLKTHPEVEAAAASLNALEAQLGAARLTADQLLSACRKADEKIAAARRALGLV